MTQESQTAKTFAPDKKMSISSDIVQTRTHMEKNTIDQLLSKSLSALKISGWRDKATRGQELAFNEESFFWHIKGKVILNVKKKKTAQTTISQLSRLISMISVYTVLYTKMYLFFWAAQHVNFWVNQWYVSTMDNVQNIISTSDICLNFFFMFFT